MAALTKRVAPKDPLYAKISSIEGSMFFDRFDSVLGASWVKPAAVAEKGADSHLIEADGP